MVIVNNAKELLRLNLATNLSMCETFIKESNLKLWFLQGQIHFIELGGDYTDYCFHHGYYDKKLIDQIKLLFRIEDIDLALYCLTHTYHEAAGSHGDELLGYYAVLNHPQYAQFFNTDCFSLKIGRWYNAPLFSPFAEAKPQNLNAKRITGKKLVEAILAGQVKKVVCNGNYTDDWTHDEKTGNSKGEWDLLEFANRVFTAESGSFRSGYYHIERKGNEIRVWSYSGEWREDYTVYLA